MPRRWRRGLGAIVVVVAIGLYAGHAAGADDGEANRLFVEAVRDVHDADRLAEERPDDRAALYERALRNFDRIITEHPDSDIAVKLIAGEPIGDITQWGVTRRAILAGARSCVERWDVSCLLRRAEAAARWVPESDDAASSVHEKRAWVYAELGSQKEVLAAAQRIGEGASRAFALSISAGIMVGHGQTDEALQLVKVAEQSLQSASDDEERLRALGWLGWTYRTTGDTNGAVTRWAEAESIFNNLSDRSSYINAMHVLIAAKIRAGDLAQATRDIDRLKGDKSASQLRVTVDGGEVLVAFPYSMEASASAALLAAIAGQEAEASAELANLERDLAKQSWLPDRDWISVYVVETYAELGRYDEAFAKARTIENDSLRVLALNEIAGAATHAGAREIARSALNEALTNAERLESHEYIVKALSGCVAAVLGISAFF